MKAPAWVDWEDLRDRLRTRLAQAGAAPAALPTEFAQARRDHQGRAHALDYEVWRVGFTPRRGETVGAEDFTQRPKAEKEAAKEEGDGEAHDSPPRPHLAASLPLRLGVETDAPSDSDFTQRRQEEGQGAKERAVFGDDETAPSPPPFPLAASLPLRLGVKPEAPSRLGGEVGAEVRMARLSGPGYAILSVYGYPAAEAAAPLLVAEAVVLGGKPVVALADAPFLHPGPAADGAFAGWRAALPYPTNAPDLPDWYRQCRSAHDLFLRPAPADLPGYAAAVAALAAVWLTALATATPLPPEAAAAHARALAGYKAHHRAHAPGDTLLRRVYGPDWTAAFQERHLFA